jgi:folate-binding protein YgfZ
MSAPFRTPGGRVALPHLGVIDARGADARSFLQGQLTNDVVSLPVGQARPAGWCSPKGRLLATFLVHALAEDHLRLVCSADLLAPTLKRLSMFVLRSRCRLADASAAVRVEGAWGEAAGAEGLMPLPPARIDGEAVPLAWRWLDVPAGSAAGLPAAAPPAWFALEAASGVARIVAATAEHFVPQTVNYEIVGGVNFKKGCFPGQEVVARSQYRGSVKRRGVLGSVATEGLPCPAPGTELFAADEPTQPAGEVVLAGTWPGAGGERHWVFAESKIAAAESGPLHLGAPGGPALAIEPLPYPIVDVAA